MTDQSEIAKRLTKARKEALIRVCRTNGGGVRINCRYDDDGRAVPVNRPMAALYEMGLIQGKAGAFETVVHTRLGLAVRSIIEQEGKE